MVTFAQPCNYTQRSQTRYRTEERIERVYTESYIMKYIHIHISLENILVDKSGTVVKVADFGLSLVKDHSKQEAEEMKKIRGSPAFMSPEALLGSNLNTKTDVYSFGMILWELLACSSPYEALEIESFDQVTER